MDVSGYADVHGVDVHVVDGHGVELGTVSVTTEEKEPGLGVTFEDCPRVKVGVCEVPDPVTALFETEKDSLVLL